MYALRRQNIRPQQTFERLTPRTQESPRELARQSKAKRKKAPQSEANMCRRKCNPQKILILHRTPNNAQNSENKLGVALSYLERKKDVSLNVFFFFKI